MPVSVPCRDGLGRFSPSASSPRMPRRLPSRGRSVPFTSRETGARMKRLSPNGSETAATSCRRTMCVISGVCMSIGSESPSAWSTTTAWIAPSKPAASGFSDVVLRQLIRELRQHGLQVYVTLYLDGEAASVSERAPLNGGSSGRRARTRRFGLRTGLGTPVTRTMWSSCTTSGRPTRVKLCTTRESHRKKASRMYSLGTETDNLFRTRSEGGDCWSYDFGRELSRMVESVRHVYDGLLTYDMHYVAITDDWPGSKHLWRDLDLDVVGVSAWFPLVDRPPSEVADVGSLRSAYERIVQEHLLPLRSYNDRPVVFLEYGAIDRIDAPANPAPPRPQRVRV